MLSVADATRTVLAHVPWLATESVPLAEARGRVLAHPLSAPRALPGFTNSAMDGYAVRAADLPGALPIAGVIAAGDAASLAVPPGSCARIFTGAPLPPELDTVVMQENALVDSARSVVTLPASPLGDNVRRVGEDFALGVPVLAAGVRITAWHLGVLAALGVANVTVARAPRVALLATGDELVDVTVAPGPGQLVDSSAHTLAALVAEAGGVPTYLGIVRDDPQAITDALAQAFAYDVVITTGGVSVGDYDHVHTALGQAGVTRELYKVAMKPGKPFSFGVRHGEPDVLVFGLPGNPVSSVVAYELFVRPALLAMQGATRVERARSRVHLAGGYTKPAGRAHYLRAAVTRDGDRLVARAHGKQGSAMMSSLVECNALVEIPAELTELPPDALATAILFEPL